MTLTEAYAEDTSSSEKVEILKVSSQIQMSAFVNLERGRNSHGSRSRMRERDWWGT